MLVRSYLQWCAKAQASERAEAAMVLARAYLSGQLAPEDKHEAEAALTLALDDSSALVRRGLAEVLCAAEDAPHHIISALAADQSDVGALVLARSPLLSDEQLVDFAAMGDMLGQIAIAMRAALSAPVAAAIAEIGCTEALIVLVRNLGADIPVFSFSRMVERLGEDGEFREALLERPSLPIMIRQQLVDAVAASLQGFLRTTGWIADARIDRLVHEAGDSATLLLGARAEDDDLGSLVAHLRTGGQLTPALLLRSLLCGDRRLFVASMAELSQIPRPRVIGIVHDRGAGALSALYRKAAMPASLEPAFMAALDSISRRGRVASGDGVKPQRQIITDVLAVCEAQPNRDLGRLIASLHRFLAEAVRDEARQLTAGILASPAPITMPPVVEAPMLAATRDEPELDEATIIAYVEPRIEPISMPVDEEFISVAEPAEPEIVSERQIAEVVQELRGLQQQNQDILAPVPAARPQRIDGDGLPIAFDPNEYALRRAA